MNLQRVWTRRSTCARPPPNDEHGIQLNPTCTHIDKREVLSLMHSVRQFINGAPRSTLKTPYPSSDRASLVLDKALAIVSEATQRRNSARLAVVFCARRTARIALHLALTALQDGARSILEMRSTFPHTTLLYHQHYQVHRRQPLHFVASLMNLQRGWTRRSTFARPPPNDEHRIQLNPTCTHIDQRGTRAVLSLINAFRSAMYAWCSPLHTQISPAIERFWCSTKHWRSFPMPHNATIRRGLLSSFVHDAQYA